MGHIAHMRNIFNQKTHLHVQSFDFIITLLKTKENLIFF